MLTKSDEGIVQQLELIKSTKEKEVYSYLNNKGEKLWMFRHKYYDGLTGKRKEKKKSGFKTEKAAIKALYEVKAQTLRGESKQFDNENITVSQWLDQWYELNKKKWKDTTLKQRECFIRLHLKPLIGHYKLNKLDRITYQREFINKLENEYATSGIKMIHAIFKIAVNAAVEEEIIPRNRFNKITIESKVDEEKVENFLTPEQLVTLLNDIKVHETITFYSALLTIAYTGMRRGEAMGLQWKNVDFTNNTITVERTRDFLGIRSPKSKNSYRTILVDKVVMNQLESYKKWCKATLLSNGKKIKDDMFIFISEDDAEPYSCFSLQDKFEKVIKRTGLPKVTLHGLRHTHATILLNNGMNVKVIAERLGNSPQMIYDIYGHILKELEQESVSLFSQSLKVTGAKTGADS